MHTHCNAGGTADKAEFVRPGIGNYSGTFYFIENEVSKHTFILVSMKCIRILVPEV